MKRWFLASEKNWNTGRKTFKSRGENQQTQNCVMFGIEPRPHWWEANSLTTLHLLLRDEGPKHKQETNTYSPPRHQSLPNTASQHQDATIRQKQTNICRYLCSLQVLRVSSCE